MALFTLNHAFIPVSGLTGRHTLVSVRLRLFNALFINWAKQCFVVVMFILSENMSFNDISFIRFLCYVIFVAFKHFERFYGLSIIGLILYVCLSVRIFSSPPRLLVLCL